MQEQLLAIKSDMAFPISVSRFHRLWDVRWGTDFLDIIQSPKVEWTRSFLDRKWFFEKSVRNVAREDWIPEFTYQALVSTVIRDSANGRPAHVWVHNPGIVKENILPEEISEWRLYLSEAQLRAVTSAMHSYGMIATLDLYEQDQTYAQLYKM